MISLSFDTDHINEPRMVEFLERVRVPGSATFFCTDRYESIGPEHEVGPHVVLENLDWAGPLDEARRLFPEAEGFRSHGCVWSHGLALELGQRGYSYLSAHDQFGEAGIRPRREAWGVWHLPIYYMDTLDISFGRHWNDIGHEPFSKQLIERALNEEGLYAFTFHPIHLMLNTTSVDEYVARRDPFLEGAPLEEVRCDGFGVASFYDALLEEMASAGVRSVSLASVAAGSSAGTGSPSQS